MVAIDINVQNNTITMTIYTKAVAQGRPRFNSYTRHAYDDAKSHAWKAEMATRVKQLYKCQPIRSPIALIIYIEIEPPKSWSKRKREQAIHTPITNRPDLDNYVKAIQDSMNGIIYLDDKQIYKLYAVKRYGKHDKIVLKIKGGT